MTATALVTGAAITLVQPLPGFPATRRFLLTPVRGGRGLCRLRSFDDPAVFHGPVTANLLAPLLVHLRSGRARQVILDESDLAVAEPLFA